MTSQATANKGWFVHIGGQPQGPFTVEQVAAKFREGVINRDTHVWCEGMAAWTTAKEAPELSPAFAAPAKASAPPFPGSPPTSRKTQSPSAQELSHLIELNPKDVDDRTSAIDPKKLRSAQKAASVALKVADKAEKKAIAVGNSVVGSSGGSSRGIKTVVLGVPLLCLVGAGAAVGLKLTTVDELKIHAMKLVSGLTSTLPPLDDVAPPAYEALKTAASASFKTSGPTAAIAMSNQTPDKPVFYVATNLPEGTHLSFALKSVQNGILSEKPVEIRFPLTVGKHLAQSKSLHTAEGLNFPQGEYTASVVAEEDQPAETKALLGTAQLNSSQKFFVGGGTKDALFNGKLNQLLEKQRDHALVEYKQGVLLLEKLDAQLALSNAATLQLTKTVKKPEIKKIWAEYDAKWTAANLEPLEKGSTFTDVFAAIHEIWANGKKVHDLQGPAAAGTVDAAKAWAEINQLNTLTVQRIAALKARLDAIARTVGASSR